MTPTVRRIMLIFTCIAVAALPLLALPIVGLAALASRSLPWLLSTGLAVGMAYSLGDASLSQSITLPNGANTTYSSGIDLQNSARGHFPGDCEVVVTAPTLTTSQLGDGQTITYSLQHDTASDFSGAATVEGYGSLLVQTGAGGAGAAGDEIRVRLPSSVNRYLRLKAVKTGASNASTATGTIALGF